MIFNQNISDIRYCRIIIARGGLVLVANEKIVKLFFRKAIRCYQVNVMQKHCPDMFKELVSALIHQDNAYAHTAASTYLEIDRIEFDFRDHQPFSPHLAQEVFAVLHLINRIKKSEI